jgi:hypothetical protein
MIYKFPVYRAKDVFEFVGLFNYFKRICDETIIVRENYEDAYWVAIKDNIAINFHTEIIDECARFYIYVEVKI